MFFGKDTSVYEARSATLNDVGVVHQLVMHARRVFLRIQSEDLALRLHSGLAWVVGDGDGVGGFMVVEVQPSSIAFITAAALSDNGRVVPFVDALLPMVEQEARQRGAIALVQVGHTPWLTVVLEERGFIRQGWVITYAWSCQSVIIGGNLAVTVRSAHRRDMPALLALDKRIFGSLWHKPTTNFEEALARAYVFTVAEENGRIVGYQWCDKHGRHGHITRLAVRPGWEGKGVGTRLLTEALVAMVKAGVTWVTLNTQEGNLRSRMLYERHGFRLIDDRVAVLWKDL